MHVFVGVCGTDVDAGAIGGFGVCVCVCVGAIGCFGVCAGAVGAVVLIVGPCSVCDVLVAT